MELTKMIVDASNNDIQIVALSEEELAQKIIDEQKSNDDYLSVQNEIETKAIAKNALLERLGITEDEAKLLLS
jgi:hypothetical protein